MSEKMPVLFCGHGSPMNAIEGNRFSRAWDELGERLLANTRPRAILAVSAHWYTCGTYVSDAARNRHVNDMYGFPPELYAVDYAPDGDPSLARRVVELLNASSGFVRTGKARTNADWGIDHGVWSVLCHLVPHADVPVVMMSCDGTRDAASLLETGRALAPLREDGVLILASGNVVHNLRALDPTRPDAGAPDAVAFDRWVTDAVRRHDTEALAAWRRANGAALAAASPDHLNPLFVAVGAATDADCVEVWSQAYQMGALSMTSFTLGGL